MALLPRSDGVLEHIADLHPAGLLHQRVFQPPARTQDGGNLLQDLCGKRAVGFIEHLTERLGYEHLYGPDVRRTDDSYRDVFLPDILPDALRRINRNLPEAAVEEAIRKIQNVEIGSLEQRNEIFNDYLQSGVEVHFFDGKEERDDIVRLLDFDDPENNDFHVVSGRSWSIPRNVPTSSSS
jgi:hypothetical protein